MSATADTLVIYHTADIHSRVGFGARLAALVEPGALLVDCGDVLAGSSTLYRRREPVLADLRAAPYQAFAVGNREFHYAYGAFARRARALPAPLLCSNLLDLRQRPRLFAPFLDVAAAGLRVRLVALLVPQYRTGSGWERVFGWRFLSPDAARSALEASENEPADLTILLSHMGLAADREIARSWPNLAAILGGHSHDTLTQPEVVNGVPIAHAGAYARYVGRLSLALQPSAPQRFTYGLIPLLAQTPA